MTQLNNFSWWHLITQHKRHVFSGRQSLAAVHQRKCPLPREQQFGSSRLIHHHPNLWLCLSLSAEDSEGKVETSLRFSEAYRNTACSYDTLPPNSTSSSVTDALTIQCDGSIFEIISAALSYLLNSTSQFLCNCLIFLNFWFHPLGTSLATWKDISSAVSDFYYYQFGTGQVLSGSPLQHIFLPQHSW